MEPPLQTWRRQNRLTQADAASLLGVSQTYVSLLEKGVRPLTAELKVRMRVAVQEKLAPGPSVDDRLRAGLSALGYSAFAHVAPARPASRPGPMLVEALVQKDLDARVAEALPWLVGQFSGKLDFPWLVTQAKLRNVQNRMGFLLQFAAGNEAPEALQRAVEELECARLLAESTFCWDSMPKATRDWVRQRRTPLAAYWNLLTTLGQDETR